MATNNAVNITSAGLVKYDGAGTFTGVTTTQHDVLVGAASNGITNVAPSATSGVPLISQGAAADPAFGTAVVAGGGTGATSFNINGVVISNTTTTGALAALTLTSGQVVIGGTTTPAAATLTAGTGISIANGNNSITISGVGGGFTWNDQGTSTTVVAGNGYFATAAITLTLIASPSQGDTVAVIVDTASSVIIAANTGQTIRFGNTTSTVAGSFTNTARGDAMTLTYRASDTTWFVYGAQGSWTSA